MNFIFFTGRLMMETEKADPTYIEDGSVLLSSTPWNLFSNRFIRLIAHAHLSSHINSKLSLPFRSIWNHKLFLNRFPDNDDVLCVMFNAHFYQMINAQSVDYIRKHFPGSKVVFRLSDKYEYFAKHYNHFPSPDFLKETFDAVYTYNNYDIEHYGFWRSGKVVRDFSWVMDDASIPRSDLFFVGQEKGRIDELHRIYEICKQNGLKCDFHIVGVPEEKCLYPNEIVYNQFMDYADVLRHVKRCNCVLNIVQEHGSGLTRRDYEALSMDKFLLTNDESIKHSDLYLENQIFMIDEFEGKVDMIKHGFQGTRNLSQIFSMSNMFKLIEKQLLSGREVV